MFEGIPAGVDGVGIAWYKRADYRRILEVMADSELLPATFDKWQGRAEQAERELRRQGHRVFRVALDPEEFVAWCSERGADVDARGRSRFVNEAVYRMVRDLD